MKYLRFITILLFSSTLFLSSCKEEVKEAPVEETLQPLDLEKWANQGNTTQNSGAEPAQNAVGLWHYTCSKGCAGGAGLAGNCSTCGGLLAHNQAYHGTANAAPTTSTPFTTPNTTQTLPEPSQNAAGVWHYSCNQGCSGGSGAAGNCNTCGNALAHNTAYHQ